MNKVFKLIGWILGILGVVLAAWSLSKGDTTGSASVDAILRYTYILLIAAVVLWVGLAIILSGKNNPKGLLKAALFLVAAVVLIGVVYFLAKGAPALNVKTQPDVQTLKMTDTMLSLVAILGIGAVAAIIFGVIRGLITNK